MIDSTGSYSLVKCYDPARPGMKGLGGGALPVTSLSMAKKKSLNLLSLNASSDASTRSFSRISFARTCSLFTRSSCACLSSVDYSTVLSIQIFTFESLLPVISLRLVYDSP